MSYRKAVLLCGLVLCVMGPAPVRSQEPAFPENPTASDESTAPVSPSAKRKMPEHYRVWIWQENGDCLWRIAEKIYGDRSKWRLIYLANRDTIRDPNKIYPKQKLRIPPPDWQP